MVGANQQSTAVWNLKGKPVLCDPGHIRTLGGDGEGV